MFLSTMFWAGHPLPGPISCPVFSFKIGLRNYNYGNCRFHIYIVVRYRYSADKAVAVKKLLVQHPADLVTNSLVRLVITMLCTNVTSSFLA